MNIASQELARIVRVANRDVPFIDWSLERQKSLENCIRHTNSHLDGSDFPIDSALQYYFFDKIGTNEHGDTSLHRLLSTHAPANVVASYLLNLKAHFKFVQNRQGPDTENSDYLANGFNMLGDPPKLDQQNAKGVTALHMAVYRNSWHVEKITQLLLATDKEYDASSTRKPRRSLASIPMDGGIYPLHILCGHSLTIRTQTLSALVHADPGIVVKTDANGENPMSLLWKNVLRFRWAIYMEQGRKDVDYIDGSLSWMTVISPEQFMEYSLLMIRAYRHAKCSKPECISLHDICAMPKCPPLLLRLAMIPKYKEIFHIRENIHTADEKGMLPLHHAARQPAVGFQFLSPHFKGRRIKTVIELLLEAYPEGATVVDNTGRLPLHYALDNECMQEESVLALVRAYPEALRYQDPASGLYPFMRVAAATATNRLDLHSASNRALCEGSTGLETSMARDDVGMSFLFLQLCPEAITFQDFQDVCVCR